MADLVIIIPVFNEEEGIDRLPSAFETYFSKTKLNVEVLLVDDGSTDSSLSKIKALCMQHAAFRFLALSENRGLSTALKAGIDHSNSTWVGYMDADLQTSPEDFLKLENHMHSHDLVTGYRMGRKDNLTKKLTSSFANGFRNWLLKDGVRDSGCPLKLMRTEVAKSLPFFKGMHRFIPALVKITGGSLIEVPIQHFPRVTGYSKFSFRNRFWGPIADTLAVRWMASRMIQYRIKNASNLNSNLGK